MQKLASFVLGVFMVLAGALVVCAQSAKENIGAARAQEVISQARAALGGEARLKAVQSLSAAAKFRRNVQNQDQEGGLEYQLLLPDKYKKTETFTVMAGVEVTVIMAVNGEQAWTDTKTFAGGAGVAVVRAGSSDAAAEAAKQQAVRADFARNVIAWLLTPPSADVQFSYVGEAEAEGGRADIISATGPNGLAVQLFLDQKTHQPLMLSYKSKAAKTPTAIAATANSDEELKQMKAKAEAQAAAAPETEVRVFLSDYRAVDGILLPHHMTKEVGGNVIEEVEVKSFKVNPPLTAQKFEKK